MYRDDRDIFNTISKDISVISATLPDGTKRKTFSLGVPRKGSELMVQQGNTNVYIADRDIHGVQEDGRTFLIASKGTPILMEEARKLGLLEPQLLEGKNTGTGEDTPKPESSETRPELMKAPEGTGVMPPLVLKKKTDEGLSVPVVAVNPEAHTIEGQTIYHTQAVSTDPTGEPEIQYPSTPKDEQQAKETENRKERQSKK